MSVKVIKAGQNEPLRVFDRCRVRRLRRLSLCHHLVEGDATVLDAGGGVLFVCCRGIVGVMGRFRWSGFYPL